MLDYRGSTLLHLSVHVNMFGQQNKQGYMNITPHSRKKVQMASSEKVTRFPDSHFQGLP